LGAYKATSIKNIQVEAGIPLLEIHFDSLQAKILRKAYRAGCEYNY
jgi:hypothetical protein